MTMLAEEFDSSCLGNIIDTMQFQPTDTVEEIADACMGEQS
jgi:hypothetical protein